MKMDVIGRARNIQLPGTKPLQPLFESIMNSIQAIDDANENKGIIEIEVVRDSNSVLRTVDDRGEADIISFIVKDNGIGFDEGNYEAFLTSDTTYKAKRGGKGIGRFLWLAAFDKVEIDSVYEDKGKKKRRKLKFLLSSKGIEDESCLITKDAKRETIVRLVGFKAKYAAACPRRLETIATLIVEQFLDIFISPSRPEMWLRDNLTGDLLSLEDFYDKEVIGNIERKKVKIKKQSFELVFVRLYSTHISDHKMNFCANDRVVVSEKLVGIPNLTKRLNDQGKDFVCAVYVNSDVLDKAVNQERTQFGLIDENGLFEGSISMEDIRQAVREFCKDYLTPYTSPIAKKKQERIQKFIENDGAMYRPIFNHLGAKIDEISPDADDNEIDRIFYEGYRELDIELKYEAQSLLQEASKVTDENFEEYRQRFEGYFKKVSEAKSSDLARYVCHRRALIEFLKKQLSVQKDGKYKRENQIHSIIFPLGKTSDEVFFKDHNLWLIDERLAFHLYLTSDKQMKQAKVLESDSKKEPDILIFDKAMAFSETTTAPFTSITVIEFKKPLRNEYSAAENPFDQVFEYIREIKAGKGMSPGGRPFTIPDNLPFFCYIICDLTEKLREWADQYDCIRTSDNLGYFMYHAKYNAYCEVISYDKLVTDSEKRNKAFFQQLGL